MPWCVISLLFSCITGDLVVCLWVWTSCLTWENNNLGVVNTFFFTITEKSLLNGQVRKQWIIDGCVGIPREAAKPLLSGWGWEVLLTVLDGGCSVLPGGALRSLWLRHKIRFEREWQREVSTWEIDGSQNFFLPWLSTKFYICMLPIRVVIITSCGLSATVAFII